MKAGGKDKDEEGLVLIDSGWNHSSFFMVLQRGLLQRLGKYIR